MLRRWEQLPGFMRTEAVRPYYEGLQKKRGSLFLKRCFDILAASLLLILLSPVLLFLAVRIKHDSKGPVFFRQTRITQYGKEFRIFKFRTMVADAEAKGSLVTTQGDSRITKVGAKLRKRRLDELPQLLNVWKGDMSFVGTRPEVPKYVAEYTDEMNATLLLPAGVTSLASIAYRNEDQLIQQGTAEGKTVDEVYIRQVLPEKMKQNLEMIKDFSLGKELRVLFGTVKAVNE